MTLISLSLLGLVGSVAAQTQYTSTAAAAVAAARATALTLSPTSNVAGTKFERYVQIFLENTDYSKAIANSEYGLHTTCRALSDTVDYCSGPRLLGKPGHQPDQLQGHHPPLAGMPVVRLNQLVTA